MKIPQTNNTKGLMYGLIDGRSVPIQPGETMMVDAPPSRKMVEPTAAAKAATTTAATGPNPAAPATTKTAAEEILEQSVKDIVELLPALSENEVRDLQKAEQASAQPRKSLLSALDERLLALKAAPVTTG